MSNPNPNPKDRFKKGTSGNVRGKPVGALSLTSKLKELLLEKVKGDAKNRTYGERLMEAGLLRATLKSDVLWKEIIERTDGKVPLPVSNPDGSPLTIHFDNVFISSSKGNS